MSLINDALKRASQTHKQQASPTAAGPEMQPSLAPEKSKAPVVAILAVSLVVIVSVSAWLFLGGGKPKASASAVVPAPRPAITGVTNVPAKTAAPVAPAVVPVVTQKVVAQVPEAKAAPTNALPPAPIVSNAPPVAAVVPAVAPIPEPKIAKPFPDLRLKGIIYSQASPQVIINGSSLGLGDEIEGAQIIKIERKKITVKYNGETKELLLE